MYEDVDGDIITDVYLETQTLVKNKIKQKLSSPYSLIFE